jgi:threonine/homoserine/homoserine lactone efflux protein
MGQVVGDILPLAVGVAVSPVPIIAVILMLFAPRAGGTSACFLIGWVAGIVAVLVIALLAAGGATGDDSGPSAVVSWLKLVLGAGLLFLAVRQWRSRPAEGEQPTLPKWMAAIDSFTPLKALGLAFLLAGVNPKNLALGVAAGVTIGQAGLAGGQATLAGVVFVVIAVSTVAGPVLAYAVASEQMTGPLDRLKSWLQANNATVMAVLLLVMGASVVGKGLAGLL